MNSWKIILAAGVIFGTGVITGGLLVSHVNDKQPEHVDLPAAAVNAHPTEDNHGPAGKPEVPLPRLAERLSKEFVHRLNNSLHLTPEQRDAIVKIVADGQERNHVLWTNVAPQMRKVMQDVNQQIRAELTPEQLKHFEELMKQPAKPNPGPSSGRFGTNKPAMYPHLDPTEEQILKQAQKAAEAERRDETKRLRSVTNASPSLPPPPLLLPTNAPGA